MSASDAVVRIELDEEAWELLAQLQKDYASKLISQAVDAAGSGPYKITAADIRSIAAGGESVDKGSGTASEPEARGAAGVRFPAARMFVGLGTSVLTGSGVALGAADIPSLVHNDTSRILIIFAMLGAAALLVGAIGLTVGRYTADQGGAYRGGMIDLSPANQKGVATGAAGGNSPPLSRSLAQGGSRGRTMATRTAKSVETVVQWPESIVSSDKTDIDLGPPLTQLLVDLGIKGTSADEAAAGSPRTALTGTPIGVSIIEAGATAASKGWATLIVALGGGIAVWGAVTNFWRSETGIQGNLAIGAAVVIAACALGAALIMYGDVRARGQGAAAQYSARAAIATAFLQGATVAVKMSAADDRQPAAAPDGRTDIRAEVQATEKHETVQRPQPAPDDKPQAGH